MSNKWEFMILDNESPKKCLGPFDIDSELNSITVVDNGDNTLKRYELRKFTKLAEYKLSHKVT